MPETYAEQLSRVRLMETDDVMWDLSDNDIAALKAVLARLDLLENGLAQNQNVVCVWCQHIEERNGRRDDEMTRAVNQHVFNCPKRPEAKLMSALMGIIVPLGIDMTQLTPGDTDALIAVIDQRWRAVMALIPENPVVAAEPVPAMVAE